MDKHSVTFKNRSDEMNFDETYVVAYHSKIFSIFPILNDIKILLKAEEQYFSFCRWTVVV